MDIIKRDAGVFYMSIYAISDLHLSIAVNKKMDVFDKVWENYHTKIKENWEKNIKAEDFVLIPGDISWGMNFKEALKDFEFINKLPGNKLISKGNHDYWWDTKSKFEKFCKENEFGTIKMIHNNCEKADDFIVCATRGWPPEKDGGEIDDKEQILYNRKIYDRELGRLKRSLEAAEAAQSKEHGEKKIIVAMHYPPFDYKQKSSDFVELMLKYSVKLCVYGHLHSDGINKAVQGNFKGINFKLVSADSMDFTPYKLPV